MVRRRRKQSGNLICCTVVIIFVLMVICFQIICNSIYGVSIHFPPIHDNPRDCEEKGYQVCTTAIGTCTRDKKKCVSPKDQEKCKYIAYEGLRWNKKKYFETHPKAKKSKLSYEQLQEIRQRYEKYCGSPQLSFQDSISPTLLNWIIFILEVSITAAICITLYPEIESCAERCAS